MLKQGLIEFDLKEIQNIQKEERRKYQQQQIQQKQFYYESQQNTTDNNNKTINDQHEPQYSIVRQQIFPTKFTPIFIDNFTKQSSSMQLYQFSCKHNDDQMIEKINLRLSIFYRVVNSFSENQKKKLTYLLQLDHLMKFTIEFTQSIQQKRNVDQKSYFSYFQEGRSLEDVEIWRFKHKEDDPHIAYQQRQSLFFDLLLLLKFISKLSQTEQFFKSTLIIQLNQIMVFQYQYLNQKQSEKYYQLGVRIKWLLNLILGQLQNPNNNNLLVFAKKMVIKLLSIQEQKQKQSKLQHLHFQQIHSLKSIQDIFSLKYHDFYPNLIKKTQNYSQEKSKQNQKESKLINRQQLQQLKQQILKLQEKAKQQIKQIKVKNQNPRIIFESEQSKSYFFNQLKKIILKNLTESQQKSIILASKKQVQSVKKQQPTIKDSKSILTSSKSGIKKTEQKQTLINKSVVIQQHKPQQVTVEMKYLCSGSDLKFRPDKLSSLIEEKHVLYIMEVFNKTQQNIPSHIGCYLNAKTTTQSIGMFGSYIEDKQKKSFIYSEKRDIYFPLTDKNYAVGYSPEIFLSIGKLDIIVPCFGSQLINKKQMLKCISYFPISYSNQGKNPVQFDEFEDEQQDSRSRTDQQGKNKTKQNQLGLEKQFFLSQLDIYEINFKVT